MTSIIGKKSMNRAFTLLETLVVLAIMAMFFAISAPFFAKFTENTKLETSARSVTSALRTARSYAITYRVPYYVFFVTIDDRPSYYISTADEAAPTAPASVVEKIYNFPVGVSASTDFTSNRVVFQATGEASEAGTITLTDTASGTNTRTIEVEQTTGRAKID